MTQEELREIVTKGFTEMKPKIEDVTKKLFDTKTVYWINKFGEIDYNGSVGDGYLQNTNNASTKNNLKNFLLLINS